MTGVRLGNARDPGGRGIRGWVPGVGAIVLMTLALAAYLILHSPLRPRIDEVLGGLPTCF